ncbi:hypothetical protein [Imhoffiella purpurea]|nr:hypothetical protein [Imhoffiella purpurea]
MEEFLRRMSEGGFNFYHVAVGKNIDDWVAWSKKYNFKMILQLDFAYLSSPSEEEARTKAPSAVDFIKKYKSESNILAFSIKEEPTPAYLNAVSVYFSEIKKEVPDANLFLLLNQGNTIDHLVRPYPDMLGSDRYAFWGWDGSAGGYSATPSSALKWYTNETRKYVKYANDLGIPYTAVFAGLANEMIVSNEKVESGAMGEVERIKEFVESRNQGWSRVDESRVKFTKYYRAPENAVSAMVWLSVLSGAKSVLLWDATPTLPEDVTQYKSLSESTSKTDLSLRLFMPGVEGSDLVNPVPAVSEYASAVQELQNFAWYIHRLSAPANSLDVAVSSGNGYAASYDLIGYPGKVIVVVNADVGRWDSNSVGSLIGSTKKFVIDDGGELENYMPNTQDALIKLDAAWPEGTVLWDISTGKQLSGGESVAISIAPGSGKMLYLGDEPGFVAVRNAAGGVISKPALRIAE